jgi:hypothetical protein
MKALGDLHRDAGGVHVVADRADHALFLGGLQDVVVLDVPAGVLQVPVVLFPGLVVGLVEQVELELRAGLGGPAPLRQAGQLLLQDAARGMGQQPAVVVADVAQHQGRALQPGGAAQARRVGLDGEVAVALVPGRRLVTRHRLHLHVHGQEVVAGVGLLDHAVQEEMAGHPLAQEAALHVGKAHHHGVYLTRVDQFPERREIQVSTHVPVLRFRDRPTIQP